MLSCPVKWDQLCETWDVSVQWLWPCREWMLNAPQKSWLCSHWKKTAKLTLTLNGSRISVVCETVLCVHTVTNVCWGTGVRGSRGEVLILPWCWERRGFLLRSFPILYVRYIWVFSSFSLFTELALPIHTFTIQRESYSTFTSYGNTKIRALTFWRRIFLTGLLKGSCYWFCFGKNLNQ